MSFRQVNSVICLLVLLSSTAHAFDENRTGFQLGIGAGVHSTEIDSSGEIRGISTSEQQMAFTFSVGYGFTEQFVIYFGGVTNALSVSGRGFTTSLAGVGTRVYLTPQQPSIFLTGIVGNSVFSEDGESFDNSPSGSGWLLGIGYEMFKHVQLVGSYLQTDVTDPDDNRFKSDIAAFNLTVEYIWY